MRYYSEFMSFIRMNFSLIKEIETVDHKHKRAFVNKLNNIRLKRNEICVRFNYRI